MELIARGIVHLFGSVTALDDIDIHVADGEVLGIIGPSGCGKSTLLSILGGLLQPTRGEVAVSGQKPPGCLGEIAYVFQDFNLLPWRTAEGNVRLPLEHHTLSAAEQRERVDDALARIGLSDFRNALPRQLSGGMRQRVGIARALAVRPAVLLLDEPLSALDAQTRDLLMEDFQSIWMRDRTTAVYVTHNLTEALQLADRVAIFTRRPGRVREIVTVDVPRAERATPAGRVRLAELHDHLWGAIRQEALVADRELELPDTAIPVYNVTPGPQAPMQRPIRFRARGFIVERHPAASLVAFAVLIALWEGAVRSGLVSELFLPSPSSVVTALWAIIEDGTLWQNLQASLFRLGVGWVLGTLVGIVAGFVIGLSSLARAAGIPVISAIYPIPKIALLPLFILWLGIGETSKVTVVALGVFFPTAIATFSAIDNVPRGIIRMAQSFDVPGWQILHKVVLPAALPGILSAFRITASVGLLLLVAAEMIGAQYGIGAYVLSQGQLMQTDNLLAGVCVISVLGLLIGGGLSWLEKRLLTWR